MKIEMKENKIILSDKKRVLTGRGKDVEKVKKYLHEEQKRVKDWNIFLLAGVIESNFKFVWRLES